MTERTSWKFRKPRSSRACVVCRMRKIRCNAEEQMPCNNCATFNCECSFPELKRRRKSKSNSSKLVTRSVIELPMNRGDILDPQVPMVNVPQAVEAHPPQYMVQAPPLGGPDYALHAQRPVPYNGVSQQVTFGVPPITSIIPPFSNQNASFANGQVANNHHLPPLQQPFGNMERQGPGCGQEVGWNGHQSSPFTASQGSGNASDQSRSPSSWTDRVSKPSAHVEEKPENMVAGLSDDRSRHQRALQNISTVSLKVNDSLDGTGDGIKPTYQSKMNDFSYFGPTTCISYFTDNDDDVLFTAASGDLTSEINDNFKKNSTHIKDELPTELAILELKGSLKLPSKDLSRKLIDCYFDHVYPHVPCIHKEMFLKHFNDPNPKKSPPLILIQAILFVGSKYCKDPAITDSQGKSSHVVNILYKRITGLLDARIRFEYEGTGENDIGKYFFDYSTVLVQVLCLLSWYWEEPDEIAKGPYYWVHAAISLAQSFGFHRNSDFLQITKSHKRLYKSDLLIDQQCFLRKKIWWWLFSRDRSLSMSFGRPLFIDLRYCDVPMITLEDYKYEPLWSVDNPGDKLAAEYFIKTIELGEVIGFVVHQQCATGDDIDVQRSHTVNKHLNIIMAYFFRNLPTALKFNINEIESQNLYSAILGSTYYITLYHVNKVRLAAVNGKSENNKYWGISFQSVYISSLISEYFGRRLLSGDVVVLPTQVVYNTSLTMILLTFHSDSSNKVVAETAKKQNKACLNFLRLCYEIWPAITVMLITFFSARLNAENYKEALLLKAKKLLFKICQKFETKDTRESTDTMDTSFILDNNSKHTKVEFRLSDADINDHSLPLHSFKTIKFPELTCSSINNFRPSDLFPEKVSKHETTTVKTASPQSTENSFGPSGDTSKQPSNTNGHAPAFNYKGVFGPNINSNTSMIAHSFDAPQLPENELFNPQMGNFADDTVNPSIKMDFSHSNPYLLDSQYFLHIDSGVDWSDYIM